MSQRLTALCEKACPLVTNGERRVHPQSYTCRDPRTRSELTVKWTQSAQGLAFATDHVVPHGNALSCDWCVCHCDAQKTGCAGLLLELKGGDFAHAVRQLASTCEAMRAQWPELKIERCVVVLSGRHIPSIQSRDYKVVNDYRLPSLERYRARKGLSIDV